MERRKRVILNAWLFNATSSVLLIAILRYDGYEFLILSVRVQFHKFSSSNATKRQV